MFPVWLVPALSERVPARRVLRRKKKEEEAKKKEQAKILGKGRTKLSFSLGF